MSNNAARRLPEESRLGFDPITRKEIKALLMQWGTDRLIKAESGTRFRMLIQFDGMPVPIPDAVEVEGTSIPQRIRKDGVFLSNQRFMTLEQTLVLHYKRGRAVKLKFSSTGEMLTMPANNVAVARFMISRDVGDVKVRFNSLTEINVASYLLEFQANSSGAFVQVDEFPAKGPGSRYHALHTPGSGTHTYRVQAAFRDGARQIVGQGQVILSGGVQIQFLDFSEAAGEARCAFTSVSETGVTKFWLQYQANSAGGYTDVASRPVGGNGTAYTMTHRPPSGTHSYRLQAELSAGGRTDLGTGSVVVQHYEAALMGFALSASGDNVVAAFQSTAEDGVHMWILQAQLASQGEYIDVASSMALGAGEDYVLTHMMPGPGTHQYRLQVLFLNGERADKEQGAVFIQGFDARVQNFALSEAAGLVRLEFDSLAEEGLTEWILMFQENSAGQLFEVARLSPAGMGQHYVFDHDPESGTHAYRLQALYLNGMRVELEQGAITVSEDVQVQEVMLTEENGQVMVTFTAAAETNLVRYRLEYRLASATDFSVAGTLSPLGAGEDYSLTHTPPSGTYVYRLMAERSTGAAIELGGTTLVVQRFDGQAEDFEVTEAAAGGDIAVSFRSTLEEGMERWMIQLQLHGAGEFVDVAEADAMGSGRNYALTVPRPEDGTHVYRLQAEFTNGARVDLDQASLVILTLDAEIQGFTLGETAGQALIEWDSVLERGLQTYVIGIREDGAANFQDVATVLPLGAGHHYAELHDPKAGLHTYRLQAMYSDGSREDLASGAVSVLQDTQIRDLGFAAVGDNLQATWVSVAERNLSRYVLQFQAFEQGAFSDVAFVTKAGVNQPYQVTHRPDSGTHGYKLQAEMTDASRIDLGQGTVMVQHFEAVVQGFDVVAGASAVQASFNSTAEDGIQSWILQFQQNSTGAFVDVTSIAPTGNGSSYSMTQPLPGDGTHAYRLQALFLNGTRVDVANDSLTLQSAPVVITGYMITASAGIAAIRWTSVKESNLLGYQVRVQRNSTGSFANVTSETAKGAGFNYSVFHTPGSGLHVYGLFAILNSGSQLFLGQVSVLV
ncbi:MAG: hypothetical protein IT285_13100 [Bdellovibrionales bacterium]|nr:hypothetical protein [Bdellovibrionales bacterium]